MPFSPEPSMEFHLSRNVSHLRMLFWQTILFCSGHSLSPPAHLPVLLKAADVMVCRVIKEMWKRTLKSGKGSSKEHSGRVTSDSLRNWGWPWTHAGMRSTHHYTWRSFTISKLNNCRKPGFAPLLQTQGESSWAPYGYKERAEKQQWMTRGRGQGDISICTAFLHFHCLVGWLPAVDKDVRSVSNPRSPVVAPKSSRKLLRYTQCFQMQLIPIHSVFQRKAT